MSTKVVRCPWCRTTNLAAKLATRRGRCRQCGHDVNAGLAYLKTQARQRSQAKTKRERARVRAEQRARPEFKAMEARKRWSRRYHRADLARVAAWERVTLAANEQDLRGVVAGTRALQRADRAMQTALRALQRTQGPAPAPGGARAVILPADEGGDV